MSIGISAILTGILSIFIPKIITVQIVIFVVFTFLLFINLRRFSKKLISEKTEETNIFALKGKTGNVIKSIPQDGRGYVKIGGEQWSAVAQDGKEITEGEKIVVISTEGNKLIVKKFENKED
jgi:membrane protein implicated in regulation of membrane protease activity